MGKAPPRASYRLQFHAGFGFSAAAAIAPYLARLGVSHVYASPLLKARPGSAHGYDIVDHGALNSELGDAAAFAAMCEALKNNGLKQILDFVPNHMGVGGADNSLWLDVLEWGPHSATAGWFDIDWDSPHAYLRGKLLVPVLGDHYGVELEAGKLILDFDATAGSFAVWADRVHKLPICPLHYLHILSCSDADLARLGDAFADLASWRPQVARRAQELKAELAAVVGRNLAARQAIARALARLNGAAGEADSWQALDALIRQQHWRVAHFRVASDDLNYRRFFNINELAGLRMELPEVFDHAHELVLRLLQDGRLDGLRIDHVDGLLDPKGYLERLRAKAGQDFYLVVEKILAAHEDLRKAWPVEGTTGYDFANQVLGVLVDPAHEAAFSETYADFTGERRPFSTIARTAKLHIIDNEMASELSALGRSAARIARQNSRTADFTSNSLQRALKDIVACFRVYRLYVDAVGEAHDLDRGELAWAIAGARRHRAELDPSIFDFLHRLLTGELARPRSGFSRRSVLRFVMRFQQFSGPVMAKGIEDTAFYRFNRFVALNEVGGDPDRFGDSLIAFHTANAARAQDWPHAMLATATHDTKRGEDTRARLAVLAEIPDEWRRAINAWSRILRPPRGDAEAAAAPDRNDEYLFHQLLVGTWPADFMAGAPDSAAMGAYCERMQGAMLKSVREAKVHSSWARPERTYETAVLAFVREALDPARSANFMAAFAPFAQRVARCGVCNSLAQTVLKLTAPGMPDIFQGAELWDLSLVDPDNRRPVDYRLREQLLDEIGTSFAQDRRAAMHHYFETWPSGAVKLAVVKALLDFRRDAPALFAEGRYEALSAVGPKSEHVCAFARRHAQGAIIVVVSRFPARLEADPAWTGNILEMPTWAAQTTWRNLLTDSLLSADAMLPLENVLGGLPVAVLVRPCLTPSPTKGGRRVRGLRALRAPSPGGGHGENEVDGEKGRAADVGHLEPS